MKKHGKITYELTEEEVSEIKSGIATIEDYMIGCSWVDKDEAFFEVEKIKSILREE